jgi:hypothetical protein
VPYFKRHARAQDPWFCLTSTIGDMRGFSRDKPEASPPRERLLLYRAVLGRQGPMGMRARSLDTKLAFPAPPRLPSLDPGPELDLLRDP